jgi:hypothetical protein
MQLTFRHRYDKMPEQVEHRETVLLDVWVKAIEEISPAFIAYDTQFHDGETVGYYPLPTTGPWLVVVLLTRPHDLWITIREWTPANEAQYRQQIGQPIEIVFDCRAHRRGDRCGAAPGGGRGRVSCPTAPPSAPTGPLPASPGTSGTGVLRGRL